MVDLEENELNLLMNINGIDEAIIFNVRSKNDSLRGVNCKKFFIYLKLFFLSDALTQYLVKKRWNKWFLVIGPSEKDRLYAEALKKSAKKFNIKIKEQKTWDFTADLRRTAGKEVPIFTKGSKYDVLVVADEIGEFGEYLAYRTWDLDQ